MATYNGHPSRNYWNVSLWIGNDQGLYRLAQDCIRNTPTRRDAAILMLDMIREHHGAESGDECIPTTPDGSPYTVASIQHAMRGMER